MNSLGHTEKYTVIDLFTPDNKRYCCGNGARRQKFAQEWQRVHDTSRLNPSVLPPTERVSIKAKEIVQEVYNKTRIVPHLTLPGNGDLILDWEKDNNTIALFLDEGNLDCLEFNDIEDFEPSSNKIVYYLNGGKYNERKIK
jgi:hypothetical protein